MFYPEIGFFDGRIHSLFFIGSMGLVNLPTGMVHFYGKLVGRYTGFWDNLFAYVSEAILCEELIPDESTLEELIQWAKENKLPMRFRETSRNLIGNLFSLAHSISSSSFRDGRLATDHW